MTDTLNDRAAANIRAELARRGITHEEFAGVIGCPRSVLSELLRGRTRITLERLETIAEALHLEPSKLLND